MAILIAWIIAIAALTALYRIIRGPHHLDRVLALDFLSIVGIGLLLLFMLSNGPTLVLDVALGLALIGFLTAYLFARSTTGEGE